MQNHIDLIDNFYQIESFSQRDSNGLEWTLHIYQHLSFLIQNSKNIENLSNELNLFCKNIKYPIIERINISGYPFTLAIDPKINQIRFYSQGLRDELFISESENLEMASQKSTHLKFLYDISLNHSTDIENTTNLYNLAHIENININSQSGEFKNELEDKTEVLKKYMKEYKSDILEKISDFTLTLTAKYDVIRIHLLKFLAILSTLDHDKKGKIVKNVFLEALGRLIRDSTTMKSKRPKNINCLPNLYINCFRILLFLGEVIPSLLLAKILRSSTKYMAKRFIAGVDIDDAAKSFEKVFKSNRDVTLDQLGELVVGRKEADEYMDNIIKLIEGLGQYHQKGSKNSVGILKSHVSIKVSALCHDFKPLAFEYTYQEVAPRLFKILKSAMDHEVFINIDAEHFQYRDLVLSIYEKVLLENKEFGKYNQTGIVLQAYLRDSGKHFQDILSLAKKRNLRMPIRLVKGAYWDAETIEALAHDFRSPQYLNKEETDINYRQLIHEILKNGDDLQLTLASHNFHDHLYCETVRKFQYPDAPGIEHQCLHMTYEALSFSCAKMGWATRNYVPIGPLLVGMSYLVRRIMENSSQVGILANIRSHNLTEQLYDPVENYLEKKKSNHLFFDNVRVMYSPDFVNTTPFREYIKKDREISENTFKNLIENISQMDKKERFPLSGNKIKINCPSDVGINFGEHSQANEEDALKAIDLVHNCHQQREWQDISWSQKKIIFTRAAQIMLARRDELSSVICAEAGKSVLEAYADVDEAIDFIQFYIRTEEKLIQKNEHIQPRGPTVVISPWNFPLAIPCGMTVAPLIAGNPVILKPANSTALITKVMCDIFYSSGVPINALIHLPGPGAQVGNLLLQNQKIASYVFTGSKEVGLHIQKTVSSRMFSDPVTKKIYPVKLIAEMGGKNAIIVTATAELDETVLCILKSTYAHSGQKCSAASRIIVHESIKDTLIKRLKLAVKDLRVGKSWDPSTFINPVITQNEKLRLIKIIEDEIANPRMKTIIANKESVENINTVNPALFEIGTQDSYDSSQWSQKEIFGPIAHIIPFKTLGEAIHIFNSTEYALTGGCFSQSQDEIDYLLKNMNAGNIYVNRTITGARVAIEPFGGHKMSGTGPKAGHRDYLRNFHHFIQKETVPSEICDFQKASDYEFDLVTSQKYTNINLIYNLGKKIIHSSNSQLKYLDSKDLIEEESFISWILSDLEKILSNGLPNRPIPGQISLLDLSMGEHKGLFIMGSEKVDPDIFRYFLMALCVGGVSIIAVNDKSYQCWDRLRNECFYGGLTHVDVFRSSELAMANTIKKQDFRTIVTDLDAAKQSKFWEYYFETNHSEMLRILSPLDLPNRFDYEYYIRPFLYERSFAINTMRHGAPLELELN